MPTQHQRLAAQSRYTPDSDRQQQRRRDRAWALLTKDVSPRDVLLFVIAALGAFGFVNPLRRISALESRASRIEQTIELTAYLQCVQMRRSDPTMLPPGCMPVLVSQERGR